MTAPRLTHGGLYLANPFRPNSTISLVLEQSTNVHASIYDVHGGRVRTLVDDVFPAGLHEVIWNALSEDGRPASSGIYYMRVDIGSEQIRRKRLLVR